MRYLVTAAFALVGTAPLALLFSLRVENMAFWDAALFGAAAGWALCAGELRSEWRRR